MGRKSLVSKQGTAAFFGLSATGSLTPLLSTSPRRRRGIAQSSNELDRRQALESRLLLRRRSGSCRRRGSQAGGESHAPGRTNWKFCCDLHCGGAMHHGETEEEGPPPDHIISVSVPRARPRAPEVVCVLHAFKERPTHSQKEVAKGRALVTDSYRRLPHTIYTRQLCADRKLSIRRDPCHPPYPFTNLFL